MNALKFLYKNINSFYKKYYLYRLIRGTIMFFALLGILYLIVVGINYFFFLEVVSKKIMFFSFLAVVLGASVEFIFVPVFKYFRVLPGLSNVNAAKIISSKISEIDDVLINVLELEKLLKSSSESEIALLNASLEQKIRKLSIFKFSNALNFNDLKKYFKYLFIPVILVLGILIFNKSLLQLGSERFINYSTLYEPESPFSFLLLNDDLTVKSGSDIELNLLIDGAYLPDIVYLNYGENKIPLVKDSKNKSQFSYKIKSINNSFSFYFSADNFKSKNYDISVLPSPSILNFKLNVKPPAYTGKASFTVDNTGDVIVPYGSVLNYSFVCSNVDSLHILMDSVKYDASLNGKTLNCSLKALKNVSYKVLVSNNFFNDEILKYNLTVIPDLYPNIKVDAIQDSNDVALFYYRGLVSDDYGFKSVSFNYSVQDKNTNTTDLKDFKSVNLDISKNQLNQEFYYFFDFNDLEISSDKIVKYYFKVTDNDYVSGFKSTTTPTYNYYIPSLSQLDSAFNSKSEQIQEDVNEAYELSLEIEKDIEDFQNRMLNEDVSSWEKQDFLDNLLKKQNNLQNTLDSLSNINQQKLNELKTYDPKNEELLKKHEEIQKLMDELMTDEIKELLDELKKLQEDFKEQKFDNKLEQTEFSFEEMSEELDRTKELLKRMEVEQEMQNIMNQLDELAEQQEKLAESFEKNKVTDAQRDSLLTNEFKFNQLMNEYDSLMQKNENLEEPYSLDDFNQSSDSISNEMNQAKDKMSDNKNKKASENIKNSAKQMKNMSQKMGSMMQQNMMQQNGEDMQTIKFLLTNLLSFSFKQELINKDVQKRFSTHSEAYNQLKISQFELEEQFSVISDSLRNLAKRNPMIGKAITDELGAIKRNLGLTKTRLDKNQRKQASISQRYTLTSVNKLALMLNESLNNMQLGGGSGNGGEQQQQSGKKPSMGDMKQMQQSMQQQLEQMINKLKSGQKPGSQSMGEQIAKREAFQKMLQEMMNSGEISPEMKEILQEINQLNEDIKKEILNNNLTPELLERENKIKTRLLEVEKSDNQRKFSDKRESQTGNNTQVNSPKEIEKYFNEYKLLNETFSKKIIILNPFYKTYYNGYVYRLGQE